MAREINIGDDSLWGEVQYAERIADGVYEIATAGHGGVIVDARCPFAMEVLSDDAWDIADTYGNWLCFEEDCAYAVPFWELISGEHGIEWYSDSYERAPETYKGYVIDALNTWYPEYAAAHDVPED